MARVILPRPRGFWLRRLLRDTRAAYMVEFAGALPILLFLIFGGLEVANMAITHMRVNQIAISLADNASRLKQESVSGAPRIREYDVNQAFTAAVQQGSDLHLKENGRMILSSLETNATGGQWIHWQRCSGAKTQYASSWGAQGTGATGNAFQGMGPTDNKVTAEPDSAVMVAEVVYEYQPLFKTAFFGTFTMRKYAAMYVRDDRDLSGTDGISNPAPQATRSIC